MPRGLKIAVAVLLLLVIADTAVWYWATGQVIEQTEAWAAARRVEGMKVEMGPPSREGWPFVARIRVRPASVTMPPMGPPPAGATSTLMAESATIAVPFWSPQILHVGLDGKQQLLPARGPAVPFTSDRTELLLPLSNDPTPAYADLLIDGLKLELLNAPVAIASARMHADFGANHNTGSLSIDGLDLPPTPISAALGNRVEHFGVDMAVDGPANATPAAWRAAGGAVHLPSLALQWGKLGVTARGDGQLSETLQPEGQLTTRVTGAPETLDALVAAHLIQANAANASRALLGLMLKRQSDGTSVVELPFTLKNQRVQMGQFPLMRVPDMTW